MGRVVATNAPRVAVLDHGGAVGGAAIGGGGQ